MKLVATEICSELVDLLSDNSHEIFYRSYEKTDLDSVSLIVAATDDLELNQRIAEHAGIKNIPVNVVDQPALCSFIFPSIVDRSPLVVAVSSGGILLCLLVYCALV